MAVLANPPAGSRALSHREARLVESFVWLNQFGKTPVDLGADWRRVDTWWRRAMMIIKSAYETQLSHQIKNSDRGEV